MAMFALNICTTNQTFGLVGTIFPHFFLENFYIFKNLGNEDCLWLNVFTRDLVIRKSRPVIVWIHGGNFVRGSAADYEPGKVETIARDF